MTVAAFLIGDRGISEPTFGQINTRFPGMVFLTDRNVLSIDVHLGPGLRSG